MKDDSLTELDDISAQTSFLAASCVQSVSAFNVHKRAVALKLEICWGFVKGENTNKGSSALINLSLSLKSGL